MPGRWVGIRRNERKDPSMRREFRSEPDVRRLLLIVLIATAVRPRVCVSSIYREIRLQK